MKAKGQPTITRRPAKERGHFDHGWLDTYHTFSFADYHDPAHMGFRSLRVINEDRVAPGRGFGTHPHRDMEIITYVLDGRARAQGQHGQRLGDPARRRAAHERGHGRAHSESNRVETEPVHLLQIWILPEQRGLAPGYEQKTFPPRRSAAGFASSPRATARDGAVTIHQDAALYASAARRGARR